MPRNSNLVRSKSEIDVRSLNESGMRMKPRVKLSRSYTGRIISGKGKKLSLPVPDDTAQSPERRRRNYQLDNLKSTLSPEYIGFGEVTGKRSRYGRAQRHKEDDDFLPTQIACYVRRTPQKVKYVSQTNNFPKSPQYESPIEKLIQKNKMLAINNIGNENKHEEDPKIDPRNEPLFGELEISEMSNAETLSERSLSNYSVDRVYSSSVAANFESGLKSPSSLSTDSAKGSSIDLEIDFPVQPGDIFWARISPFPYWPCIIWPDPTGRTIVLNNNKVQRQNVKIHVRFFGDNGRRGWVHKTNMLPYCGRADFDKRGEEYASKYGRRNSLGRAFEVTGRRKSIWETAIEEADEVCKYAKEDRQNIFEKILQKSREIQAQERIQRRKSMNCGDLVEPMLSSEQNGIREPELNGKRERSPDINKEDHNHLSDSHAKRMKVDNNNALDEIMLEDMAGCDAIFNEEYAQFLDLIKKYVLKKDDLTLERCLEQNVRRLWYLRHLASMDASDKRSTINIRKLSLNLRELQETHMSPSSKPLAVCEPVDGVERGKVEKKISKPIEEVVDDIMDLGRNYLFKGLSKESVCKNCQRPSNLVKCAGKCQLLIHKDCGNVTGRFHITGDCEEYKPEQEVLTEKAEAMCSECSTGEYPKCFVCKKNNKDIGDLIKCHVGWCPYHYHLKCLKYWPQSKITKSSAKIESLLCSAHVCHTCVSDDPRGKFFQIEKSKLIRCVECPATYHSDSFCIPAGTKFLTASQIVCPRHGKHEKLNINANWCFICATGGSLICCDTCPTAFHLSCLNIPQPDGNYICEECETGRLPLYGEMVWAKLGNYRWWPAIIIPPTEIPRNLQMKKHDWSEFCIRFFGTNDHTWINRNRVFLYQEGDWGKVNNTKGINQSYKQGLEEAKKVSELLKRKKQLKSNNRKDKGLAPLPYIKIKFNRSVPPVKLQEIDASDITPCECSPDDSEPCGPYSGCLNRLLVTECNPKVCPAGTKCQNQLFEKRIYPPLKVCWTSGRGWGLFCDEDISSGSFVIEYVGEVIDDNEFQRRIAQKQEEKDENYYFLTLEKDYIIDAGPKGNLARFMNHSCEPNCETQKWTINGITRIGLFAIKDIPAKTELTFNYNLECLGNNKKICHCGSNKCAGFIGSKYKELEKPPRPKTEANKTKHKKSAKRHIVNSSKQ